MIFFKNFFIANIRNLVATLGNIYRRPWGSLLIIFLIGIILSLPLFGFMIIKSLEKTNDLLSNQLSIHVYLQDNLTKNQVITLEQQIYELGMVKTLKFMSKAESLAQFDPGLGELLADNPLPDMLVLTVTDPRRLTPELTKQLEDLPGIDMIASDITWINNLSKIVQLVTNLTIFLGSMLILTVSIMITNTIKLLLERQREQIKINRLIGATTGFILREFMYYGLWYGLLGAILAIIITSSCMLLAKFAIMHTFGASINLPWYFLTLENSAVIIVLASSLGLLSAAFSITDQLRKLEY